MNWIVVGNVGNGLFGDKDFFGIIEIIIYIYIVIQIRYIFKICIYILFLFVDIGIKSI